jgi:signal transduction histidine kinase
VSLRGRAGRGRRLKDIFCESLAVARSLTADLTPPVLYRSGLTAALQWLGDWCKQRHGLDVRVVVEQEVGVIAEDARIALFRAVRELLYNVVKHAGVRSAEVRMGRDDREVWIRVLDDGSGFDVAEAQAREGLSATFGLFSLRERLSALGARMEIDSASGAGTVVLLRAPVHGAPGSMTPDAREELD